MSHPSHRPGSQPVFGTFHRQEYEGNWTDDEPASCTGMRSCSATPHVHGCCADAGDCDNPLDHVSGSATTHRPPRQSASTTPEEASDA